MSVDPTNQAFTKITDTIYDSKVFEGLVSLGILPKQFRVLKGTATPLTAGVYAVLDESDNQILLTAGQQILTIVAYPSTALAGGTTLQLGLSATATGAAGQVLSAATALATINTNGIDNSVFGYIVGATNKYLTVTGVGTHTAGVLDVIIVVC